MGRPFYPHEADDPDLDWLVSNFLYERPDFVPIETGMLPLMLLPFHETAEMVFTEEPPISDLDRIDDSEDGTFLTDKK